MVDSNQGDNYVSFESVAHPGQHIGVRPGGDPKPPANTGRGPEGSFCPVYVDEVCIVICSLLYLKLCKVYVMLWVVL